MDGYAVVKISLGGSHLDGHTKSLQHLIGFYPYDVQSHNLGSRGERKQEGEREDE